MNNSIAHTCSVSQSASQYVAYSTGEVEQEIMNHQSLAYCLIPIWIQTIPSIYFRFVKWFFHFWHLLQNISNVTNSIFQSSFRIQSEWMMLIFTQDKPTSTNSTCACVTNIELNGFLFRIYLFLLLLLISKMRLDIARLYIFIWKRKREWEREMISCSRVWRFFFLSDLKSTSEKSPRFFLYTIE